MSNSGLIVDLRYSCSAGWGNEQALLKSLKKVLVKYYLADVCSLIGP